MSAAGEAAPPVALLANPQARAMLTFPGGLSGLAERLGLPRSAAVGNREVWGGFAGRAEPVAVAGGDGTLRCAVQALGPGARIVPVPMGHGNDLCRRLGLTPGDLEEAKTRLAAPRWREVDLWRAEDAAGNWWRFVNSLGVGLDAAVNRARLRLPKWVPYIPLFLLTLQRLRRVRLEVLWEGGGWAGKTWWLGLMNSGLTGGGLALSPEADPGDGLLDMFAIRSANKASLLALLPAVQKNRIPPAAMERARAAAFTITGPARADLAIDGDLLPATLPLRVEREGTVEIAC